MKTRFISSQVLLNKDGSMKAQRVYEIPQPAVVSFYMYADEIETWKEIKVGVLVQDWNTSDCLDNHPDLNALVIACEKHFGLSIWRVTNVKKA